MQTLKLNDDKTKLLYDHQDSFGGCSHEISVKTLLKTLKPVINQELHSNTLQLFTVEITREEFLKLPIATRRRIISKQALLVCQKLDGEDGYKMME